MAGGPVTCPKSSGRRSPSNCRCGCCASACTCRAFASDSVTLVTTLLDPENYPAEELARLYAERWRIELWFRDIKTSMGMEVLRCKTPKMVHKELEMFFIAYNLIRCLMAEAGLALRGGLDRLSFKGTVDSVRQFAAAIAQARSRKKQNNSWIKLLEVIARDRLPERSGPAEPRAVKRRPKALPTAQSAPQAVQGNSPPKSLLEKSPQKIKSLPIKQWRRYLARQLRGLVGEFPHDAPWTGDYGRHQFEGVESKRHSGRSQLLTAPVSR